MAAILSDRPLGPRADFPTVGVFSGPRANRRGSIDLALSLRPLWRAAGEWLALLWMLAAVAFSLLLAAGAVGILG